MLRSASFLPAPVATAAVAAVLLLVGPAALADDATDGVAALTTVVVPVRGHDYRTHQDVSGSLTLTYAPGAERGPAQVLLVIERPGGEGLHYRLQGGQRGRSIWTPWASSLTQRVGLLSRHTGGTFEVILPDPAKADDPRAEHRIRAQAIDRSGAAVLELTQAGELEVLRPKKPEPKKLPRAEPPIKKLPIEVDTPAPVRRLPPGGLGEAPR